MKKGKKGKKGLVGLIVAVAVVGGAFGVKSCKLIGTGKTGMLMVVIDDEDDEHYTVINENGCVETIDLESNCYEKVGEYTLIETVIWLLNECREVLKNRE